MAEGRTKASRTPIMLGCCKQAGEQGKQGSHSTSSTAQGCSRCMPRGKMLRAACLQGCWTPGASPSAAWAGPAPLPGGPPRLQAPQDTNLAQHPLGVVWRLQHVCDALQRHLARKEQGRRSQREDPVVLCCSGRPTMSPRPCKAVKPSRPDPHLTPPSNPQNTQPTSTHLLARGVVHRQADSAVRAVTQNLQQ